MQKYLPSIRDLNGVNAPVIIKADALDGEWLPPMAMYKAADVDPLIADLRRQNSELREQLREWKNWLAGACV